MFPTIIRRIKLFCPDSGPFWFDVRTDKDCKILLFPGQYYPGFHKHEDSNFHSNEPAHPVLLDQDSGEVIWSAEPKNDRWHFDLKRFNAIIGEKITFTHGDGSQYIYTVEEDDVIFTENTLE
ncbi:hypothetical protein [Azospirillum agricola]|uniref:hypothetical protein n=1 Tax=Azospirillum agricola TaxID=1720247 RepID=UPI0011777240|nr:hypothetical protein [Azospirillum agricola]